jgi:peptide/nickel transport system substrate-binding protein
VVTRFTGRGRSRWILAAAAAALLALVAACGGGGGGDNFGSTQTPQAKGRQGDVYRAPQVQPGPAVTFTADTAWTSYNNATADSNSLYNSYVNTMALASPTWTDADGSVVVDGDVMDGIDQVSTNPQVVRWRIKPGVKWSDGQPWNCKDFYLSYLAQSGKVPGFLPAGTNGYQDIGSAVCTDDNTMVTTFAKPYADYRGLFGQGSGPVILPAHVLEQRTGIPDIRQVTPQSPPDVLAKAVQFWNTGWNGFDKSVDLSSGPYMLDSWVQDQSVTMVRNPQWAGAPGGPERITYRNIADATAEAQALQNNEVQVAAPQVDVNAANLMRGLAAQGVKFQATTGSTYEHLDMNFKNPLFQDKAVRTAFAQCVNRQELVDKLIKGVQPDAAPLQSLIYLPNQQGYQDSYSQIATGSAAQSNQTLTQDGWVKGADGIYAKNGQRLQFRISHTNVPRRVQTVQLVQAQCAQAGMQIVDDNDPNFLDQRVSQGDYDVALFGWINDPFISSHQSIYATGGGQNWQSYSNPQVDAVMNQAVSNLDPNGFRAQWQQADKLIAADIPSIPLFVQPNMVGYTDRIDNVYYQPNYGPLYNANEWVVQGG